MSSSLPPVSSGSSSSSSVSSSSSMDSRCSQAVQARPKEMELEEVYYATKPRLSDTNKEDIQNKIYQIIPLFRNYSTVRVPSGMFIKGKLSLETICRYSVEALTHVLFGLNRQEKKTRLEDVTRSKFLFKALIKNLDNPNLQAELTRYVDIIIFLYYKVDFHNKLFDFPENIPLVLSKNVSQQSVHNPAIENKIVLSSVERLSSLFNKPYSVRFVKSENQLKLCDFLLKAHNNLELFIRNEGGLDLPGFNWFSRCVPEKDGHNFFKPTISHLPSEDIKKEFEKYLKLLLLLAKQNSKTPIPVETIITIPSSYSPAPLRLIPELIQENIEMIVGYLGSILQKEYCRFLMKDFDQITLKKFTQNINNMLLDYLSYEAEGLEVESITALLVTKMPQIQLYGFFWEYSSYLPSRSQENEFEKYLFANGFLISQNKDPNYLIPLDLLQPFLKDSPDELDYQRDDQIQDQKNREKEAAESKAESFTKEDNEVQARLSRRRRSGASFKPARSRSKTPDIRIALPERIQPDFSSFPGLIQSTQNLMAISTGIKEPWMAPKISREVMPKEEIALRQQFITFTESHRLMKMLDQLKPENPLRALILKQFFLMGYLSLEQGLSALYLQTFEGENLEHSLQGLIDTLEIKFPANLWVSENDEGTLIARYPLDCIARNRGNKLPKVLQWMTAPQVQPMDHGSWARDLVAMQLNIMEEMAGSKKGEVREFAAEFAKMAAAPPAALPEAQPKMVPKPAILEAEEKIKTLYRDFKRSVDTRYFPPAQRRALKNVLLHLKMLLDVMPAWRVFPEQEFVFTHVHSMFFASQYILEIAGRFMAKRREIDLKGHDLKQYYDGIAFLSPMELSQIKALNVHKGLEYLFLYFSQFQEKGEESEVMNFLSELYSYSLGAEGFIPKGAEKPFNALLDQAFTYYIDLSKLLENVIRKGVLQR